MGFFLSLLLIFKNTEFWTFVSGNLQNSNLYNVWKLGRFPGLMHIIMIIVFATFLQKLWELAKQVSEFLVWRQVICPFDRDRRILQYLVTTSVYTEDGQYKLEHFHINYQFCKPRGKWNWICVIVAELHLASYESEGPENNMEKDSRRSLRWVKEHFDK